jgi:GMP synthase-like glutamine amidotransferase
MDKKALILQHVAGEGPGLLDEIFQERDWTQDVIHLYRGQLLPQDLQGFSLLLIMGGPMNVDEEDRFPFLKTEVGLIRMALQHGLPMLGICLGAQLMAKAAGARVYHGPKKEIGWYEVQLTEEGRNDPFLSCFPPIFPVFQWHGDTFDLPPDALPLVSSEAYTNQAFRISNRAYGLQFHLEITNNMIESWLEESKEDTAFTKGTFSPDKILSETPHYLPQIHSLARQFFSSFLDAAFEQLSSGTPIFPPPLTGEG